MYFYELGEIANPSPIVEGRNRLFLSRQSFVQTWTSSIGLVVGNGDLTDFWEDMWIEGVILKTSFPIIYVLAVVKSGMVSSFGT